MRAVSPATLLWLRSTLESPILTAPRNLSPACLKRRTISSATARFPFAYSNKSCSEITNNGRHVTRSTRLYSTSTADASKSQEQEPQQPQAKHRREEPLRRTNYYDLFPESIKSGPPPRGHFTIDLRQLRREYLKLQAQAHPDLAPEGEKAAAQAKSARINEAYRTLQHPLLRAQYLLALKGVDVTGDETMKIENDELLMEVMEVREEIESAESEEEVEGLRRVNESRIEACVKILEEAFDKEDVNKAKTECVKLRYWINVRDTLHAWEKGKRVEIMH